MTQYKAFNAFIFAGSFSIGVMDAGFDLKGVLEISDKMLEQNAFYFHKNYPNIPIVLPKEWENDEYLDNMKKENYDLMCCNCPCSSLSRINRWAKVDGERNIHFYRLFNVFSHVQPKVFVIENAPTLIKLGFPILRDMVKKLKDLYKFTIIRDFAGNHNVPMKRQRTMVVGWRKDAFPCIPILHQDIQKKMTIQDALADIWNNTLNDNVSGFDNLSSLYKYVMPHCGTIYSLAKRIVDNDPGKDEIIEVVSKTPHKKYILDYMVEKIKNNKGFWDKSPKRMLPTEQYPSFSGPQEYLHPVQNRTLNTWEMKRLMGYPDSFDVSDPNKECKCALRVAMAQGVPVNFGKWIATQVKNALDKTLELCDQSADIVFQHHSEHRYSTFTYDEFEGLNELTIKKKDFKNLKD